jgi:hypothetical protein
LFAKPYRLQIWRLNITSVVLVTVDKIMGRMEFAEKGDVIRHG